MALNDSWIELSLEEKYQYDFEQIMTGIRHLGMTLAEINTKLGNYNERLVALEQQRKVSRRSPVPKTAMKKEGAQGGRSFCEVCTFTSRCCKYYFDDLYDITTQEFNISTGLDVERLRCSCTHPIRIHDRDPSMSLV